MNRLHPNHPSILFDLGICAEYAGDYPLALIRYRGADSLAAEIDRRKERAKVIERVLQLIAAELDQLVRETALPQFNDAE